MAIASLGNPSPPNTPRLSPQNYMALEEVVNAIAFGQRTESITLLVVRCNYAQLGETLLAELLQRLNTESLQGPVHTLQLNCFPHFPDAITGEDLVDQLQTLAQEDCPGAMIILGLEAIPTPEKLFAQLNRQREQVCHQFAFPLVLWMTDKSYSLLAQYANDLESISGGTTLSIQPSPNQLLQWLHTAVHNLFETLLQPNSSASVEQRLQQWDSDGLQHHELAIALAELQEQHYPITLDLQINITFAQGLQYPLKRSETLFAQSATYWQNHAHTHDAQLKRGLALF
ncbi:MAG: hypothetical protein F6K30_24895 [Cyanothece sp. SIO2G6]|nr:hypothetical protein [Cyanothece sp. SIO2G6]